MLVRRFRPGFLFEAGGRDGYTESMQNGSSPETDPLLSTGRRRSAVLSASVIARPNGRGQRARVSRGRNSRVTGYSVFSAKPVRPRERPHWLLEALQAFRLERVEALLSCPGIRVNAAHGGETALTWVVRTLDAHRNRPPSRELMERCLQAFQMLLAAGADPNTQTASGESVLTLGRRVPEVRDALLARGADPSLGLRHTALTAAIACGEETEADFWLARTPPGSVASPNPWKPLLEHHVAPPKSAVSYDAFLGLEAGGNRWSEEAVGRWARRLLGAGFGINRPLTHPASAQPASSEWKEDPSLDTPLIWACDKADPQLVSQILDWGADPHAFSPNGRHPFLSWVDKRLGRFVVPASAEERSVEKDHCLALRFLTPELLKDNHPAPDSHWAVTMHPLAAILNGPIRREWSVQREWGWRLARTLLKMGLVCPPPISASRASRVERALGELVGWTWFVESNQPLLDPQVEGFLRDLPGWREAQAVPCSDRSRLSNRMLERSLEKFEHVLLARPHAACFQALERTGVVWPLEHRGRNLAVQLCDTPPRGENDKDKKAVPLPADLVEWFLDRTPAPLQAEVTRSAFACLLKSPYRPGLDAALSAFGARGWQVDSREDGPGGALFDALMAGDPLDPEVIACIHRCGATVNPEVRSTWNRANAEVWYAQESSKHHACMLETVASPTRAVRRARL